MLAPKAETEGRAKAQWYGEASWASLKGRVPSDAWDGDPKRNEDALAVDARSSLFGLYDGNGKTKKTVLRSLEIGEEDWSWAAPKLGVDYHIGSQLDPDEAAHLASRRFKDLLQRHASLIASADTIDTEWEGDTALREGVRQIHSELRERCLMGSATTAVVAKLIPPASRHCMPTLLLINVGDSRAVLGREGKAVQVSRDHTADKNIGAEDFDAEEVHIGLEKLKLEDEFLVLMSDGVYNAFEDGNDGVVRFVRQKLARGGADPNLAGDLVHHARQLEEAKASPSSKVDDMSAVVILLRLTSEQGALQAYDGDAARWDGNGVVSFSPEGSSTARFLRMLTSIPRWQCALLAALVCVAVTMGLLFSFRAAR